MSLSPSLPDFVPGSVWLVGAGPGDPGLLTVLGAHALNLADIVLYDALVNTDLLSAIGPQGRARLVGRRKGRAAATVEDVVALMLRHVAAGQRVVRLKGGDPFVFGRGAEEAQALAEAGVPFRVVPGITAGIGGLAYGGIAATRRGVNESVTFVTGHGEAGSLPDGVDWAGLARDDQTLVVYMGLSVLDAIATRLLGHGRDHRTPVAILSSASTSAQRLLLTTLGECALAVRRERMAAPATIVIGRNADPANIIPWFDPASSGDRQTVPTPARDAVGG
jgi:uroporphyrin-III C-methyltransferase